MGCVISLVAIWRSFAGMREADEPETKTSPRNEDFCQIISIYCLQPRRAQLCYYLESDKSYKEARVKKMHNMRTFVPMSAVAAAFGMASTAQAIPVPTPVPVFDATFPASWNGTSTTVTDQYGTTNVGFQSGTTHATYTTAVVPPSAPAMTGSMALDGSAGIKITPTKLLNNGAVWNNGYSGGFIYNVEFMWDGTDSTSFGHAEKLVDYAGTESLQLVTTSGSATLEMLFGDDTGNESAPVSTTISPNTWYNVTMEFDATSLVGGDVNGTASLVVNGGAPITGAATKGTYGDSLNRPIAIGELAYGHTTSIVGLHGDIYSASVQLLPEPSTLGLLALGGLATLRRTRRRKSS